MIPNLPSLQTLRILDATVRLRSYSAAAEELGLTHGAVSRQVRSLEHWAGAKLFRRQGRRMEPTVAALALAARTRQALHMLADAAFSKPSAHGQDEGLTISTTAGLARFWLVPRLARLHAEHPGLVRAIEAETTFFESSGRRVDVAIRYGAGGWSDVQFEQIGIECVYPVAAPSMANASGMKSADGLLHAPLIETPYHSWRDWFDATGSAENWVFRPVLTVSDSNLAMEAALAGYGVALVRSRMAIGEIAAGRLVRLSKSSLMDTYAYHLVWRSSARQRRKIELLKTWLVREMAPDDPPTAVTKKRRA